MRREKTEQHFVDLTPSERLPARQNILKRVDLEVNALTAKPLGEQRGEGAPGMGGVEEQPQLSQGDDSFAGEIPRLTNFRRDLQPGRNQRGLDVGVRAQAVGLEDEVAHGLLDLRRDRRHLTGQLPLERSDVVADAERLEMLFELAGKRFTRAIFFLEKKSSHRAKQRAWHPLGRAVGAVDRR